MQNHGKWWHQRVIYQIYPRSFCDSNGDGIGDIEGIISKLDYLKQLGVGALWLSPVYKSPNADNGYDIADYIDINPEYGTLDDMKRLLKEADIRDIKIIMDLVINHTSDEHRWFTQSIDPSSPYHDYYIWRPGIVKDGNEYPPNNWESHFTGSAWSKHPDNGLYYLHLFAPKQPDLNYHNPKVVEEVKRLMKFWLDLGVAGFRCDVINMIFKTSLANGKKRLYAIGKEHYLSQAGSHLILKQFHDEVWQKYDAYTVGETVGLDGIKAQAYTDGQLETVFQFDHTAVDQLFLPLFRKRYRPALMRKTLQKWQQILPWNTLFFENHDIPRSISRFGDEGKYYYQSATMLATILMTLRGTPFVYQGQEIGCINTNFNTIDEIDDVSSRNVYDLVQQRFRLSKKMAFRLVMNFCRDHARTPLPWNSDANGGFTTGTPWLRLSDSYQRINVLTNMNKSKSIWHYYQNIIALRNSSPMLQTGAITFIKQHRDVLAFSRQLAHKHWTIYINLSSCWRKINKPITGKIIIDNYHDTGLFSQKRLAPYQALIIEG
jgi:oligo-1,6-glucosidase